MSDEHEHGHEAAHEHEHEEDEVEHEDDGEEIAADGIVEAAEDYVEWIPHPNPKKPDAVAVRAPADPIAEERAVARAFLQGLVTEDDKCYPSVMPCDLYYEILQYIMPIHSSALVAGPHPKGELWLEQDTKLAVCKLGPAIVMTEDSVSCGKLLARFSVWGSQIFSVGAISPDVTSASALWYADGCCGFFNDGAGCKMPRASLIHDRFGGTFDVILDMDNHEFAVVAGPEKCYRARIPAALEGPLGIGFTLWAGGRVRIVAQKETFVIPLRATAEDRPTSA